MGLPNEYCPTIGSTRAVVALLGAAGGAEYGVLSRTACLLRVLFGLRAEWGCGSRPADVLCSTSGAPRLHGRGQAVGRPESLELRAHHARQPILIDRVRAFFSRSSHRPRETLQALMTPAATVVLYRAGRQRPG